MTTLSILHLGDLVRKDGLTGIVVWLPRGDPANPFVRVEWRSGDRVWCTREMLTALKN